MCGGIHQHSTNQEPVYVISKHHLISIIPCGSVYNLFKSTLKIDTHRFPLPLICRSITYHHLQLTERLYMYSRLLHLDQVKSNPTKATCLQCVQCILACSYFHIPFNSEFNKETTWCGVLLAVNSMLICSFYAACHRHSVIVLNCRCCDSNRKNILRILTSATIQKHLKCIVCCACTMVL